MPDPSEQPEQPTAPAGPAAPSAPVAPDPVTPAPAGAQAPGLDAAAPAPTREPVPSDDAAPSSPAPAPTAPAADEKRDAAPLTAEQFRVWLEQASPEDRKALRKERWFASIVGDEANLRAEQLAEQKLKERTERERRQRLLDAAAQDDDLALLDLVKPELKQEIEQQKARIENQQSYAQVRDDFLTAFQATLPEAVFAQVAGKHYDGFEAYLAAVRSALDADVDTRAASRLQAEVTKQMAAVRAQVEKELRASLRREVLGEAAEAEPAPERLAGEAPSGGSLTLDKWESMTYDERRKLPRAVVDAMIAAAAAGVAA